MSMAKSVLLLFEKVIVANNSATDIRNGFYSITELEKYHLGWI